MALAPDDPRLAHGLGGFTRGCRCPVCRCARVDYDKARRASLRLEREADREAERASRPEPPIAVAYKALLELGIERGVIHGLGDWPQSVWRTFAAVHGYPWELVEPHGRVLTGGWSHDWTEQESGRPARTPWWVFPEGHPERERSRARLFKR